MSNAIMHTGNSDVMKVMTEIIGAHAYYYAKMVDAFIVERVTNYWNSSIDFYEFEKGQGYIFPSLQYEFNILNREGDIKYTVGADEFGIAAMLYIYDCIIQADIRGLSKDDHEIARAVLIKVQRLRDVLYEKGMREFNGGNLKYIIEA